MLPKVVHVMTAKKEIVFPYAEEIDGALEFPMRTQFARMLFQDLLKNSSYHAFDGAYFVVMVD